MDQQDHGPDKSQASAGDKQPAQGKRRADESAKRRADESAQRRADESANDSNWGMGSASALDNLRRHDYGARRSRPAEADERPSSD